MNNEFKVREAIANYFVDISNKMYNENPGLLDDLKSDMKGDLGKTINGLVENSELSRGEALELASSLGNSLNELYSASNHAEEVAKFWTTNADQYCGIRLMALSSYPSGKPGKEELREAFNTMIESAERRDNVVNNLVNLIKSRGIDNATTDGSIKYAVKEEFPTSDDYSAELKKFTDAAVKMGDAITKLEFIGFNEFSVMEALGNDLVSKVMDQYQETIIKADIKELYNS